MNITNWGEKVKTFSLLVSILLVLDCERRMIRVFDYEMNEVASIKLTLKWRFIKEWLFVKIYLECLGYRNVDYSKVVRKFFWVRETCFGLIGYDTLSKSPQVSKRIPRLIGIYTNCLPRQDCWIPMSTLPVTTCPKLIEISRLWWDWKSRNGTGHQVLGITPSLIISFPSVVGTYVSRWK